ncbi:MAG TPA: hypothetical protein P5256_15410 [Beijerinckiaceae bacterium]|nr:hypothetical protein [Beijerinckiaceae bacterium]
MTNTQTGAVTVQAQGKQYTLKFSINALCALEAELGAGDAMDLQQIIGERPSITVLRTLMWAGLQEHHPGTSKDDAGRIMDLVGLVPSTEAVTTALVASMNAVVGAGASAPFAAAAAAPVATTG